MPKFGVHDLRHTHATFLLLDGASVTLVSTRLGGAKVNITLDTYAHILPGMQEGPVDALGTLLFSSETA